MSTWGAGANMTMGGLQMFQNRKIAKENMRFAREQFAFQQEHAKHGFSWLVDQYKRQGLHPMLAAGATPSNVSPVYHQADQVDFGRMGQAIQRFINSFEAKALKKIELRTAEARARHLELQNEALENDISGQNLSNLLPTDTHLVDGQPVAQVKTVPKETRGPGNDPSVEYGITPQDQYVRGPFGIINRVYNKDIGDTMESDTDAYAQSQAQRLKLRKDSLKMQNRPVIDQHRFAQKLLKIRPNEKEMLYKSEIGKAEIRWDYEWTAWRVMPKENKFYVQEGKGVANDGRFMEPAMKTYRQKRRPRPMLAR